MAHRIHFRAPRGEMAACGTKAVPNWITRACTEVTCDQCKLTEQYRETVAIMTRYRKEKRRA